MWSVSSAAVDEAKEQALLAQVLRVLKDPEDDPDVILLLLRAALGHVERITGTWLIERECTATTTGWNDLAHLPVAPVTSIEAIVVQAVDGVATLDPSSYRLTLGDPLAPDIDADDRPPLAPKGTIAVTLKAGYAAASLPQEVWWAVNLLIGQWYRSPLAATDGSLQIVPNGVHDILVNHRRNLL